MPSVLFCFPTFGPLQAATLRIDRSDAELRQALIGTWQIDLPVKYYPLRKGFATYHAGGAFEQVAIAETSGFKARLEIQGKWSLKNGILLEQITKAPMPSPIGRVMQSKIISLDQGRFVLRGEEGLQEMRRGRLPVKLPPVSPWILTMLRSAELIKSFALETPTPSYPHVAQMNRIEGSGIFRLIVSGGGNVGTVEILQSTGNTQLDQAATGTLKQWRFKRGAVKELVMPVIFILRR